MLDSQVTLDVPNNGCRMIPLKLLLHNFLSYRDCTIDFTQLHIAAIAGANGHGKSALLDGVT